MSEQDLLELTPDKLKKLKNLRMFRDKTDEEIFEFYRNRAPKPEKSQHFEEIPAEVVKSQSDAAEYTKKYKAKLKTLETEYGIDMNNSNDAEMLRTLAKLAIQQEIANDQIIKLQREDEIDTRNLKNLGDYQRGLVTSIADIQDKLGISRKIRREKDVDEVSVFIGDLKKRAREFYERKTVPIRCENCRIELARYWLNFAKNTKNIMFDITCPKCEKKTLWDAPGDLSVRVN